MAIPRALIEMVVDGAAESRRQIETVRDALRGMNSESLERISGSIGDLSDRYSNLQSTIGSVAGFAIAGVSLATLGTKVADVLNSMGDLDDLSQKIGTSVERLSQIQKVAKMFGVDFAGAVDPALVKLAQGLSTVDEKSSQTRKALAAIGMSARDAAGKMRDPGEAMIEVVKRLQDYEDGAGKAAVVNALFGESGVKLMPFFNDLAEHVDKQTAVTKEAAKQATELQDRFGALSQRTQDVFQAITVAALPAMSGLVQGFTDVLKAEDGLVNSGEIAGWAGNVAMGIARVADVAVLAVKNLSLLASSVGVIFADLELLWTMSPANMAINLAQGKSPLDEVRRVSAERDKILEAANKKWADHYAAPWNMYEQAVLKRLSNKAPDAAPDSEQNKPKNGQPKFSASGGAKETLGQADAYSKLTAAIQAKIAAANLELSAGEPLSASQQEQLKLTELLAEMKGKLTPIQYALLESEGKELVTKLEVIEANARAAAGLESYTKSMVAYETSVAKAIENALTEADSNERLALTFGKTKGQIEAMELAELEYQKTQVTSNGLTLKQIEDLDKLIAAKRRSTVATGKVDTLTAGQKAAESLDEFLDPAKAQSFGEALRESFGAAGTALSALTASFDGFSKRQAEFDKKREEGRLALATGQKTEMQYMQDMTRLGEMETKNRLAGYGDMAVAAKGFFEENSIGYKMMEGAEKAFRAFELASQMESLYTHLFVTTAKATGTTVGQGVETAAVVAGEAARNTAKVPGVFMSFMSALGPWGMAAAGVAIAAVMGGAFSGGGSVDLSKQRQETQGTGTVLGSDAKSESIANALSKIESATLQGLGISNGMLTSLRNIEAGIGQFASYLVRSTGVAGDFGSDLATKDGNFFSKLGSSIFGGKKTVEDTGFLMKAASFADVFTKGVDANQYADIKTSGGWFSSSKMKSELEGLGPEGNTQIRNVLLSLYDTVSEAGEILGVGGDAFKDQLNSFVVDLGKVSLKGLSGEEIQEELSAVFSKVGDELAAFGVDGLAQFQKVGEGYLETLASVATNYQAVTVVTDSMGMAFSAVGLASVGARERLINLVGGLDEFTSGADQFLSDFYTDQERANSLRARITPTLDQFGIKTGAADSLQQFRSVVTSLDLTTEAGARAYATLIQVAPTFKEIADVDTSLLEKRSELEVEVMELLGNKSGALAASRAIELAGLDASLLPLQRRVYALQDEAAALETSNSLLDIQAQIYELTGDKAGAAAVLAQQQANALAELDPALRGATLQLWGLQAAAKATEKVKADASSLMGNVDGAYSVLEKVVARQKKALQEEIDLRTKSVQKIEALSQSLRSTLDSMTTSEPTKNDRLAAQTQIQAALAMAKATGNLPKADDLKSALAVVSKDSAALFATQEDYLRDFYATKNGIQDLAGITDKKLSTEELSLKSLESQVKQYDLMLEGQQELIDLAKGESTVGISIVQALQAINSALLAANANPLNAAVSKISDAYQTSLGRAPDAAGLDYWKNTAAAGNSISDIVDAISNSPEAKIKALYQSTFGRPADAAGLQYWMDRAAAGTSYSTIEQGLKESDEYKTKKIPGYAAGGDHAGGWRIVGENGPELEATGAARIFNFGQTQDLMRRLANPAQSSDVLVAEVRALREEVALLRKTNSDENYSIAKHAMNTASALDDALNGEKPLATKVIPA